MTHSSRISAEHIGGRNKRLKRIDAPSIDSDSCSASYGYAGFSLNNSITPSYLNIPLVSSKRTSLSDPKYFFQNHVSKRRPGVLDFHPGKCNGRLILTREIVDRLSGKEIVQVEQRTSKTASFGERRIDGKTQVRMTMSEFVQQIVAEKNEMLYLSTQEIETEERNDGKLDVAPPCRNLIEGNAIEENLEIAGNLILSACHLWIGKSSDGSSSGLHHDHHDNFYLLLKGKKRFRIFSPDCAQYMETHGTIEKVHFNGSISYIGSETRADGVPIDVEEIHDSNDVELPSVQSNLANSQEGSTKEEDESCSEEEDDVVLGKGFDYQSSDDENAILTNEDDFDNIMTPDDVESDPPFPDSFSRIPTTLLNDKKALNKKYPLVSSHCKEYVLELRAGQTLYLPAGWFHEVTSYGNSEDTQADGFAECHVALNYWYHPPDDLNSFVFPYVSDFWRKASKDKFDIS